MMAMARFLFQQHNTKFLSSRRHFVRSFARQSRATKEAEPAKKRKPGVLSMAERCKIALGVNWRGQLTTLTPRLANKEEREKAQKTVGELSNYIILDEKAVIWVPEDSQHSPNLILDNRASFIVGHTDPSPLMKAFQQTQKPPPHTLLCGVLIVPDGEEDALSVGFMKMVVKKQLSELEVAVEQSSPSIRSILTSGSHVLRSRVRALNAMLESKEDDMFYRFDASSCHYIDTSGNKHLIEPESLLKAHDPLSPLLPVVVEGINRNHTRRKGLKLLCTWFLRVRVQDIFMYSADRWGLNAVAKMESDVNKSKDESNRRGKKKLMGMDSAATPEWKDLRLTFKHEVNDLNEFFATLAQMEKECVAALNQVRANSSSRNGQFSGEELEDDM